MRADLKSPQLCVDLLSGLCTVVINSLNVENLKLWPELGLVIQFLRKIPGTNLARAQICHFLATFLSPTINSGHSAPWNKNHGHEFWNQS